MNPAGTAEGPFRLVILARLLLPAREESRRPPAPNPGFLARASTEDARGNDSKSASAGSERALPFSHTRRKNQRRHGAVQTPLALTQRRAFSVHHRRRSSTIASGSERSAIVREMCARVAPQQLQGARRTRASAPRGARRARAFSPQPTSRTRKLMLHEFLFAAATFAVIIVGAIIVGALFDFFGKLF